MHTNTLRSFCLCILQQRYNSHWMSSSTPSTPKSNWKTLNRNRSGITKHVIKIAYESFPLCSHPCEPAGTERCPQSVTYWRMWVPRCRSVDKIEKLISFVDTWESDRSDFFPPVPVCCHTRGPWNPVLHFRHTRLLYTSLFWRQKADWSRWQQNSRQKPKLICYVSFHISYYYVQRF